MKISFLSRQACLGGLLLATGGCVSQRQATPMHPAAALPTPLTMTPTSPPSSIDFLVQQEVNAEYIRLYNLVAAAKAKAERKNKPLIILAGESHQNVESLLYEYMLLDISHRLQINEAVFEIDEAGINKGEKAVTNLFKDSIVEKNLSGLTPEHKYFASNVELMGYAIMNEHPLSIGGMLTNMDCILLAALKTKMKCVPGDPYHQERGRVLKKYSDFAINNKYGSLKSKHENAMAASIVKTPESCIAFYGLWHVMPIYNVLQKNRHEVLVINCSPDQNLGTPTKQNKQIFANRLLPLKRFYAPKVKSELVPLPFWVLKLSMLASTEHRLAKGEIAQDLYKRNQFVFQGLSKDLENSFIKKFSSEAQPQPKL